MRHDGYLGKLKEIIFQNKIKYVIGDQDVLNDVFSHKIKPLSISWNFHHDSYFTPEMYVGSVDRDKDKFIIIMNNPCIRHFTPPRKPWLVGIKRKLKNEYLFYERLTPFYKLFLNIKKYQHGDYVRKVFSIYDKLVYLKRMSQKLQFVLGTWVEDTSKKTNTIVKSSFYKKVGCVRNVFGSFQIFLFSIR